MHVNDVTQRPLGVSIIAAWQVIVAMFFVLLLVVARLQPGNLADLDRGFATVGISGKWILVSVVTIAALTLLSGIGLWTGERAGWWLGCFCSLYGVLGVFASMHTVVRLSQRFGVAGLTSETSLRFAVRLAINLGILFYLMRADVMDYLDVPSESRFRSLGYISIGVITIYGLTLLFGRTPVG